MQKQQSIDNFTKPNIIALVTYGSNAQWVHNEHFVCTEAALILITISKLLIPFTHLLTK